MTTWLSILFRGISDVLDREQAEASRVINVHIETVHVAPGADVEAIVAEIGDRVASLPGMSRSIFGRKS
jgi:hypothetical protein